MRRSQIAVLCLVMAGSAGSLRAQTPTPAGPGAAQPPVANGEVRGTIIDSEGNTPLPRGSVAVRTKTGSAVVAGALVGTDGTFRIQGLRPGAYILRVTAIGYGPHNQEFAISPASPTVALGNIGLAKVAVALQGVEVTADRPVMAIEPDRNAYRAKDVAPAAANASDVLDAVPSVQVDGEGKVSLRGNENVAVQINGRPAPITGPQLGAYLKQLPASIVERIEVIPNPSARYDPEGMAGIINIVLKQNTDLGLSGGVTAGGATADRYNASGNLGYQSGPLTMMNTFGFQSDMRDVTGVNDRETYNGSPTPLSFTDQEIGGTNNNSGQNYTNSVDYKLNPRDVLSNALVINHRNGGDNSESAYSELSATRSLLDRYDRLRNATSASLVFDNTISLKRTFVPRKHELSGEVRFNRSDDDDYVNLWRQPLLGTVSGSRIENEIDNTNALTYQLIGQLDYTRPLGANAKLESGYKGNARWLDRDFLVQKDDLGTGSWIRSDLSNSFQFDEQVQAAYGVLSENVGKVQLQGGLRAEYANRTFSLAQPATSYPHSYTSLFPSGVISYSPNDATTMKISYSRRIRRPGTQELNPFPVFFDAQNVFIGNPALNPEYTDAIELGLSRTGALGSIQLSPFYRHTTDVIRVNINTADTVDGRSVTSVSFQNLATGDSYGTDLNGSLRLGKKFNGFGSFNVFKMVTDGGSQSALSSNAVTWSARVNGTAQMSPKTTLQGSYFYRAPVNVERGRFSATQQAVFSVRQKLMGDQSSVTLRVIDPFNTIKFRIRAGDDNVVQLTERRFGVRAVFLTFQYNFGQVPKIRPPRQDAPEPQAGFPPP